MRSISALGTWRLRDIGRARGMRSTTIVVSGRVLAAAVVFAVGFYGWAAFQSVRHDRAETAVISKYTKAYHACMATGGNPRGCPAAVYYQCASDPFWKTPTYSPWPLSDAARASRCLPS